MCSKPSVNPQAARCICLALQPWIASKQGDYDSPLVACFSLNFLDKLPKLLENLDLQLAIERLSVTVIWSSGSVDFAP